MFRSMQSSEPSEAWSNIHPMLKKYPSGDLIADDEFSSLLSMFCLGIRGQKETVKWAIEQGLILDHQDMVPTGYSRTDEGCKWVANTDKGA